MGRGAAAAAHPAARARRLRAATELQERSAVCARAAYAEALDCSGLVMGGGPIRHNPCRSLSFPIIVVAGRPSLVIEVCLLDSAHCHPSPLIALEVSSWSVLISIRFRWLCTAIDRAETMPLELDCARIDAPPYPTCYPYHLRA